MGTESPFLTIDQLWHQSDYPELCTFVLWLVECENKRPQIVGTSQQPGTYTEYDYSDMHDYLVVYCRRTGLTPPEFMLALFNYLFHEQGALLSGYFPPFETRTDEVEDMDCRLNILEEFLRGYHNLRMWENNAGEAYIHSDPESRLYEYEKDET